MNRKSFIKSIAMAPLAVAGTRLRALASLSEAMEQGGSGSPHMRMPVLFLGHGSPMNAIEENVFVAGFRNIAGKLPRPKAILCVSAHWETKGTYATAMEHPRTIHDFGGFPEELYAVQYPAPGDPQLAQKTKEGVKRTEVGLDQSWGLDHGAWSVIKHLYPAADVPVVQLSLDATKGPRHHFDIGRELSFLRDQGILIIGSGNIVHNLGRVAWEHLDDEEYAYDWSREANQRMKEMVRAGDPAPLIDYAAQGGAFRLAIPTAEHFLPLLYVLALRGEKDDLQIFNDGIVGGSISMTSFRIG